jgi:TrmH family RNA methyltransferase
VIRTADAAGADGVVLTAGSVDPHNGKCVRASAGSLWHLPVVTDADALDTIAALQAQGVRVLATTGAGEADLDELDGLAAPTAWVLGTEAHGLPAEVLEAADVRVRIPIHGRAESLNLATAAAVCLYSSARAQRRASSRESAAES